MISRAEFKCELAKLERSAMNADGGGDGGSSVLSIFAMIGTALTNWHQATIYFSTSNDEKDLPMWRKAPLIFADGVIMVLVQIVAMYSILAALENQPCVNNLQCEQTGFYCSNDGRCQGCGQYPPPVPYVSNIPIPGEVFRMNKIPRPVVSASIEGNEAIRQA